jgi:exonuclease SbcC
MLLQSIALEHIRSYTKGTIVLQPGSTLLLGDIGSGKSTVLLAIEFALFGISRSELTGSALLRHGAQDGAVSVTFDANGTAYTITRTLRRTSSGIVQDNGWIDAGNGRENLTPSELRARVFTILGYPPQFLAKQRNVLYRFTIYTPQEEMKAVLTQTSDERVETVRRIFGIDAYRIARDNARLVAKALRERDESREAIASRLRIELKRLQERLAGAARVAEERERFAAERSAFTARVKEAELRSTQLEDERAKIAQERSSIAMRERARKSAEQELAMMQDHGRKKNAMAEQKRKLIAQLRSTIDILSRELGHDQGEDATMDTATLQEQQRDLQSKLEAQKLEEGKLGAIIAQTNSCIGVHANGVCPTCKQRVSAEHIAEMKTALDAQRTAAERKLAKIAQTTIALRQELSLSQMRIDRARQLSEITENERQHKAQLVDLDAELKYLDDSIATKQAQIKEFAKTLADATVEERARLADQAALDARSLLSQHRAHLLEVEKRLARIEQEETQLLETKTQAARFETEIAEHGRASAIDTASRAWLTRQFSPFTSTLEQYMLAAIHQHFDSVFREWFGKLMEDDSIGARIDSEFSPVIVQSGYETDSAHLSGGERTSVSLAWRLALVHTIHALVPDLGTAGLIILDEPTDGFSSEQLERVRDVLRELAMEQIILVSHEQQLEGFVDHILRVRKGASGSAIENAA